MIKANTILTIKNFFRYCGPILLIGSLVSCDSRERSKTQLVNGLVTSDHPAIVKLNIKTEANTNNSYFSCTGTFISNEMLITAAHCLADNKGATYKTMNIEAVFDTGEEAQAVDYYVHAGYHPYVLKKFHSVSYDLALIKFPKNTSSSYMNISSSRIAKGDKATLVGYGVSGFKYLEDGTKMETEDSNSGQKQEGQIVFSGNDTVEQYLNTKNHVRQCLRENGCIITEGRFTQSDSYVNRGQDVSLGQGDSGGPMFVDGKGIVGIASGGTTVPDLKNRSYSHHTDLHSEYSKEFFVAAKAAGFEVNFSQDHTDDTREGDMQPAFPAQPANPPVDAPDINDDQPEGPNNDESEDDVTNPPILNSDFKFIPISEGDGIFSFEFKGLSSGAVSIEIYWNTDRFSFKSFSVNGRTSFKTERSYGLGFGSQVMMRVLDADGQILAEQKQQLSSQ